MSDEFFKELCNCENLFTGKDFFLKENLLDRVISNHEYHGERAESKYTNVLFKRVIFEDVHFINCMFTDVVFYNCKFSNCYFTNCVFERPKFMSCYNSNKDNRSVFDRSTILQLLVIDSYAKFTFEGCEFINPPNILYSDISDWDVYRCPGYKMPYLSCPSNGEFTAYKKAIGYEMDIHEFEKYYGYVIVELIIPEDAKRSSATGDKCRADKAIVKRILDFEGNDISDKITRVSSIHAYEFKYSVGDTIYPMGPEFDDNRFKECAPGIHFFIDFRQAVDY